MDHGQRSATMQQIPISYAGNPLGFKRDCELI
jgi:hypothetical protein